MKHHEVFSNVPVSSSTEKRWAVQPVDVLDAAAMKIAAHGAEPWVFVADARHFWQFAGSAEEATLQAFTQEEHLALMGEWSKEEYNPDAWR